MRTIHSCRICHRLNPALAPDEDCDYCGAPRVVNQQGNVRAIALASAASILLFPSYFLPVMDVEKLGSHHADTIFSGVMRLWTQGMWGLAIIVFSASILIPVLKLLGLGILLWAEHQPRIATPQTLMRLHTVLHNIGRWSMLDIFLVAFLCGIVRFHELAHIEIRSGAIAFAGVVILTILATDTFDPNRIESRLTTPQSTPPSK